MKAIKAYVEKLDNGRILWSRVYDDPDLARVVCSPGSMIEPVYVVGAAEYEALQSRLADAQARIAELERTLRTKVECQCSACNAARARNFGPEVGA